MSVTRQRLRWPRKVYNLECLGCTVLASELLNYQGSLGYVLISDRKVRRVRRMGELPAAARICNDDPYSRIVRDHRYRAGARGTKVKPGRFALYTGKNYCCEHNYSPPPLKVLRIVQRRKVRVLLVHVLLVRHSQPQ